ncbi:putative GNAT family acetyltransferase [Krasilnikovia cinnamomea]|uniref:Putative GNAT family acetyltransferase n=1 Tax=Krasilnikovia cinnamomea TaxID=349313 RepID=A0A4Q7ZNF1_9ACTN|nr:GNAT family N-acetyltransferase [Krasilnikovia cinnamomea]RZU51895.1 putative GNAT family acetyltransferase [Krasilnikovia cinnamomea]
MTWHNTDSVAEFAAAAGDYLRSRPVEHSVPLTLVRSLELNGPHTYGPDDPIFGWWRGTDGAVSGAYLQTPPYPLLLTAMPAPAVPALAEMLAGRALSGVNARAADAEVFVGEWQRRTGATGTPRVRTRLFRLGTLTPPDPHPPGRARVAGPGDRDLLVRWIEAFHDEVGESVRDSGSVVDDKLAYGGLTLWEIDGEPVSMAGTTRPEAGMVRVLAVYTPRERRGRGYAGAVVSVVSRAAADAGATDVVLFTDLANPTSNALYQRLGYRPVEDRVVMEFAA